MMTRRVIGILALGSIASPIPALAQNPEQLLKWAGAQVIHYDVVAEYSAPTSIIRPEGGLPGKVSGAYETVVKDRFEISFDYSPTQVAVIGKPVFGNSASVVAPGLFAGACRQPPPVTGTYDHLEVVDVGTEPNGLVLTTKRTYVAGSVPLLNEVAVCGLHPVPAMTAMVTHRVPILPGTYIAMPQIAATARNMVGDEGSSAPNKVIVGTDGKTMILDDSERGWKYTYTLRITK